MRDGGRNDAIDGLRGMSIILVVLFHIQLRIPFEQAAIGAALPRELFNVLFRSGYYGVVVFFTISGFLITSSSIRRWGALERVPAGAFYGLRFARIVPCLALLLPVLAALHLAGADGFVIETVSLGRAVFAAATFHLNWLEAATGYLPGAWDVLWSLSVEEAFYLFFPLICLAARRGWAVAAVLLAFVILGPFARTAFTANEIWADKSYLSGADGIALGCLAAYAAHRLPIGRAASRACLAGGLVLVLLVFVFRRQTFQLGLTELGLNVTLLGIGVALLLVALRGRSFAGGSELWLLTAPVRWFGRNSYEVYLTHMLVLTPLAPLFAATGQAADLAPLWFLGLLLLSGLLGDVVARFYSEPLNRTIRARLAGATPPFDAPRRRPDAAAR
ncbi:MULTISPECIES: acyltransferase family protein [unclassified Inquilinus]|uniref:acyltransferase family protein n=1 Tax=unclassified Inquilinus TaxID=2645927 RepID=UPI003F8FCC86